MAKTGSYIKLDRGLKSNSLWLEKPFSKGQAWVDLLLLAQGVDKEKQYRGKIQQQKSGVVYTSVLYLTSRWGWSRNRVYRFLEYLENAGMVEIQGRTRNDTTNGTQNCTTNGTIIAIEKWALYQCDDTKDDTKNGTQNRTRNGTHNRKQYTKESNKENIPPKSPTGGLSPSGYPYPCGLFEKPVWMTDDEWVVSRDMTVDDIPGSYRGEYDSVIDYLSDKKKGWVK